MLRSGVVRQAAPGSVEAVVTGTWQETAALWGVRLEAAAVAAAHRAPGQHVTVTIDGSPPAHFALASAPGQPLELLVKHSGGGTAERLSSAATGAHVRVTPPAGPGFPVDDHHGRDLVLCASGSAIAPIRAVVQHVISHRRRWGSVRLLYGQRHAGDFAYAGEVGAWQAARIEVTQAISGTDKVWTGPHGRIQDVVACAPADLAGALALVCGQRDMIAACRHALAGRGVKPEDVLVNY
jgi:NAD(P)H-flavin reductase